MPLIKEKIKTDLCVIGGGMAGLNVAITASRLGLKVVLIHERAVLGGNASGEIRMWICGTPYSAYRESGLTEEINLENLYYNPTKNYALWDALLYGKVQQEQNLTPLLNCTCFNAKMNKDKIESVTAYQMTTQTLFEVQAKYFADCSGDSILAPLTNAEFWLGREGKAEFNEPMKTHELPDSKTMGNSCLIQARKTDKKVEFHAPEWAEKVSVEKLKSKYCNLFNPYENFWYIELGGELDTIQDAESINKRLVALCLSVWDTVKNSGEFDADNFELEFLGLLGAKRESRRMIGDYILTANDIMAGKVPFDTVAYGGWPLDDHYPEGFDGENSNYSIIVKNHYGIPYRCLYSKNVENLFFAGRNISATHMAMSSARVMGTCSVIGQAVGVASFIANKYNLSPRGVLERIEEVQQLLLQNDCYLPNIERRVSALCIKANLVGASQVVRNGKDRSLDNENNLSLIKNGSEIKYELSEPTNISGIKLVFDSDISRATFDMHECERRHSMRCNILDDSPVMSMPKTLAKSYVLTAKTDTGESVILDSQTENKKRSILVPVNFKVKEISLVIRENWGKTKETGVFTFEIY